MFSCSSFERIAISRRIRLVRVRTSGHVHVSGEWQSKKIEFMGPGGLGC